MTTHDGDRPSKGSKLPHGGSEGEASGDLADAPVKAEADLAKRIESAGTAVDDGCKYVTARFTIFVLATLYLAISVGSITDNILLFNGALTLPMLNVALPVLAFCLVAPIIYVVLHANLLTHLNLLAEKLVFFGSQVDQASSPARAALVHQFVFAHFFLDAQPRLRVRVAVGAITRLTIVVLPLLLLCWVQVHFLRLQSLSVTAAHWLLILVDVAFLVVLWPPRLTTRSARTDRDHHRLALACAASLILITFLVMVVPTDLYGRLSRHVSVPNELIVSPKAPSDFVWRLMSGDEALAGILPWLDLRARRLRHADFQNTTLIRVDLRDSDLESANFRNAKLIRVDLRDSDLASADFSGATLIGVDLRGANLMGGILNEATLQDCIFREDDGDIVSEAIVSLFNDEIDDEGFRQRLRTATLTRADLSGASIVCGDLYGVDLRGAILTKADLRGARLDRANLRGANLRSAQLDGACFAFAQMDTADLRDASCVATDFSSAWMRGIEGPTRCVAADLHFAKLTAANFSGRWLSGADFQGATLDHAILRHTSLARANITDDELKSSTDVFGVQINDKEPDWDECQQIIEQIECAEAKNAALSRLDKARKRSHPIVPQSKGDWDPSGYVTALVDLACEDPYSAREIANRAFIMASPPYLSREEKSLGEDLSRELLKRVDKVNCDAVRELPKELVSLLRQIVAPAPSTK